MHEDVAGTVAFDIIGTCFSLEKPRKRLVELGAPTHTLEMRKVGVLIEAGFPRFSPNFSREWFAQTLRDAFALSYAGGYQPLKEVLAAEPRTLKLLGID